MKSNNKIVVWGVFFTLVNSVILAVVFDLSPDLKVSGKLHNDLNMSFSDLAAVLLAASALIVTAVGVLIGVLAFVGYNQIKKAAQEKAEDHLIRELDANEGDTSDLRETLESIASAAATAAAEEKFNILAANITPQDDEFENREDEYGEK